MTKTIKTLKNYLKNNYWSLIIVILFLLFLYLLHWNSFTAPWERDEGEYGYSAWLMQQNITPYENSFIQKPPLIIYTYYLSHLISPFSIWLPRLIGFLFTLATCVLLALSARKLYGPHAGWLALWLSSLLLTASRFGALAANTEKFMLLPLAGLIALYVYKKESKNIWVYFAAGILGALAILYKPIALLPVIFLLAYWLITEWLVDKKNNKFFKALLFIFLGAGLTTFLSFAYFIWHGAWREVWQQIFIFNLSYAKYMESFFPEYFYRYGAEYFNLFWPILIISLASFIRKDKPTLWWVLLFISLGTIITTRIVHYYLLLAPFFILIAASGFAILIKKIKIKEDEDTWRNFVSAGVIAAIIMIYAATIGEQFFLKPVELTNSLYGPDNALGEQMLMADKVREYTKLNDKIFIGGSEPQIYYFSKRQSASKFNISFPISINTPWRDSYQNQAINELKNNPPAAIVLPFGTSGLMAPDTPPKFIEYLFADLKNNYRLIGGVKVAYEAGLYAGPEWFEAEQLVPSSDMILLYLKK